MLPSSEVAPAFRSLVVVPRSHNDGTFQNYAKDELGRCQAKGEASRAIQLDIRPNANSKHQSAFILWNSRLVHQGATYAPYAKTGFRPPVQVPSMFDANADDWKVHLNREGYVVIKDLLESDNVKKALNFLLADIKSLNPKIQNLDQVRGKDLPPAQNKNDLRISGGICHGKFAWFLRTCPEVSRVFEMLFDLPEGAPMTGSVDVVALAPPASGSLVDGGKNWLHLDYSPPFGDIWQGTLQIFPDSRATGSRWARIAIMICKAPVSWASPSTAISLLAACVVGAASKATAAVTEGELHPGREDYKGPRLIPELADSASLQDLQLQRLKAQEVAAIFKADVLRLRTLIPHERREYVSPVWPTPERQLKMASDASGFRPKGQKRSRGCQLPEPRKAQRRLREAPSAVVLLRPCKAQAEK